MGNNENINHLFEYAELDVYALALLKKEKDCKAIEREKARLHDVLGEASPQAADDLINLCMEETSLLIDIAYRKGMRDMMQLMNVINGET